MFGSKDLLFSSETYGVAKSLRFRSSASAYLNRTFSAGNRKTWTWSAWVKRGSLGSNQVFISSTGTTDTTYLDMRFNTTDNLQVGVYTTNVLITTQVFRDPSAWYHIVWLFDTTQASASNRCRLFVNGSEITVFSTDTRSTYFALNTDYGINNNTIHNISRNTSNSLQFIDGYLAEVNFIDGQALTPSSFGFYDNNGIWQPKGYTGTYGTNGFYLKFTDVGATSGANTGYGKDFSGFNTNYWTTNNFGTTSTLTTYDSMYDSPVNASNGITGIGNYCVMNPLWVNTSTLSNGNLNCVTNNAATKVLATFGMSSGKWYWEYSYTDLTGDGLSGIATNASSSTTLVGNDAFSWAYFASTGNKRTNSTSTAYGNTYAVNDVIAVAFDADNGALYFGKISGGVITWQNSGVPTSGASATGAAFTSLTSGPYFPAFGDANSAASSTLWANFGQRPFSASALPSGYSALNTQNLSTPTISNGAAYMAATTYTGTSSSNPISNATNNTIGTTFQPDFVWIKNRNYASGTNHVLIDSVRGASLGLASNLTNADFSTTGNFSSINNNGFTVTGTARDYNFLNDTFVGWQWNAGGAPTTDNVAGAGNVPTAGSVKINGANSTSTLAGSIAATRISANTSAGFSVVTYTGNGTAGATVGHGLGAIPSMIIVRNRVTAGSNWPVYHSSLNETKVIYLNLTNASSTTSTFWNNTAPTSAVFSVGTNTDVNESTKNLVAYCFAPVSGYSAFGSYTGNGSSDGPFVYTGFRPRWVLIKDTTNAATNWMLLDTSRDTYNVEQNYLSPNTSSAEGAATAWDGLSNGFKLRGAGTPWNASGATMIYAAFAENPFKISRAR